MSYAFELTDAHLAASLRRILRAELGDALARLDRIDEANSVHGLRKNLKKTRALLRLVRSGLATQPDMNIVLREVGLAFSARRDSQVRLVTFDRLFPDMPEVLHPLRAALLSGSTGPADLPISDLRDRLAALRDSAADLNLSGKDSRILREGLAITRDRARRAARLARAEPDNAQRVHDWRKCAKDHWYQARLFAPCWPEMFRPLVACADRLGEILGDHHDISVLELHVADLPDTTVSTRARQMLDVRLHEARSRIEIEAFPLSARLFAGDPDDMAALWVDWRRIWRKSA